MDSWFFGLETSITSNMILGATFSSSVSPLYANAWSIHLKNCRCIAAFQHKSMYIMSLLDLHDDQSRHA
jgi:hypothetical protein